MKQVARRLKRTIHESRRLIASRLAQINERPILVLGNQKSGTTAIAALIAQQADLSATLDLERLTASTLQDATYGRMSLDEFIDLFRLELSRDLIKEPRLTFLFPLLYERFPRAQFVFIVRDPRSNIRSILNRLQVPGHLRQIDPREYKEISPEWLQVIDGFWMGLHGNNYIEMLAARWNRAADLYLEHHDLMLLARYEDFLPDKVGYITQLVSGLGLPCVHDIAEKVDIPYQPQGNRDVAWKDFFGPSNLRYIERMCGERMQKLGYDPNDQEPDPR